MLVKKIPNAMCTHVFTDSVYISVHFRIYFFHVRCIKIYNNVVLAGSEKSYCAHPDNSRAVVHY